MTPRDEKYLLSGFLQKKFVDPCTGISIITNIANMQQKHSFKKIICIWVYINAKYSI